MLSELVDRLALSARLDTAPQRQVRRPAATGKVVRPLARAHGSNSHQLRSQNALRLAGYYSLVG